ncbi:hypothetical protein AMATHDRAFT_2075 [Amanita thiersii Skay4041]|uniref:Carbohydrate kinase PfkB domain-containing protein n=1 Tax=Amanita thiersii Skay4041 TaxID=703135 RepID=A0A2A9NNX2_9AGAR|nr:hypothetical protein AMATHDRAFT_2075 [Amanita thiersii Skay4041]
MVASTFVTLGMFIIDEFSFMDKDGNPSGRTLAPQIGGGGTYAAIGARIWLAPDLLGMIVDRGHDFPSEIQSKLQDYGEQMWSFRDRTDRKTTRALNSYLGDYRMFQYLTPRIRISPRDLTGTKLAQPQLLHFICSAERAWDVISEIQDVEGWSPVTIYEPIPDRCIPSELPALIRAIPNIFILSPNAEEALSLLSMPLPPTKQSIETAADRFLSYGIGSGSGWIIVRSGAMGSYAKSLGTNGIWTDAFWSSGDSGSGRVVDVTGAGNSFLGGLAAGLALTNNVVEATLYASVSASFVIEQEGLPGLSSDNTWNGDSPKRRLELLRRRSKY